MKKMAQPVSPKDKDGDGKIEDWEVESAMEDFMRVEKHKAKPKMMEKVKKLAGRKVKALQGLRSLDDLKQARNDYFKKKMESDE